MKSCDILEAMTDIRHAYIASAQQRLGYLPAQRDASPTRSPARALRRTVLLAAALVLLLAALLTTAMAANEEFRERVFAFFHIQQTEVVPDHGQGGQTGPVLDPGSTDVGGVIRGTYVHAPGGTALGGLFLVPAGGDDMDGFRYDAYREENGELVKLEARTFSQDCTILGQAFHVEFQWVEHNGSAAATYTPAGAPFSLYSLPGGDCTALLMFHCNLAGEGDAYTQYPVLLDLETGELSDVLAGTGAEALDIFQAAISEDRSKMVLSTYEGTLYCAGLTEKKLYNVDTLSGEHADGCSLIGGTLSCWALEGADVEAGEFGSYRAWAIDLDTLARRELFHDVPATGATSREVWEIGYRVFSEDFDAWAAQGYPGMGEPNRAGLTFLSGFNNAFTGSVFAVEVDAGRNVYGVDLTSGERIPIDGWQWPELDWPDLQCVPSADGKKLLIYAWKDGICGEIGILDFEKKSFIQFSRENLNDVEEFSANWFGDDSVVVRASDAADTYDYYIYTLLDQ